MQKVLTLVLIILVVGLVFVSGCINLEEESEKGVTVGRAVVDRIAEGYEELNPPYENVEGNESS